MTEETDTANTGGRRLPFLRLTLVAVVAIVTAIVVLQNTEVVETKLLFATVVMPRAVLLFTTFASGLGLGLVLSFLRRRSKK